MRTITIGTRTSQLARWQTDFVAAALVEHWPGIEIEIVPVITKGDRTLHRPLPEIGGKGLFTAELEQHLRSGEIDLAVHSLKDLPVENSQELTIGAVLGRQHVQDVLISRDGLTLASLPPGAVIGTSSLRRQAQLLAYRPDLSVQTIRGNVDTRIQKVMSGEYDAAVLALAGVERLGLTAHVSETLSFDIMLPAPGQGALAVQCRSRDEEILSMLRALDDAAARSCTSAERQFLYALGGGCSAPIAALSVPRGINDGMVNELSMRVRVLTPDGSTMLEAEGTASTPQALAHSLAAEIKQKGGNVVLSRSGQALFAPSLDKAVGGFGDAKRRKQPLEDKRIVVTRAEQQAGDMVAELRAKGAKPLLLPAIRFEATATQSQLAPIFAKIHKYDWLIFTSASAVRFFCDAWSEYLARKPGAAEAIVHEGSEETATNPRSPVQSFRVAAVGPATAQTAEEVGLTVDCIPYSFTGEAIVDTIGNLAGARVLLPRSAMGRPELVQALRDAGASINEIALYQPVSTTPSHAQLLSMIEGGVDIVTFTSPSTVNYFVNALRAAGLFDRFQRATIACIGPTTAQAVRESGLHAHIVAGEHTVSGLIDAMERAAQ